MINSILAVRISNAMSFQDINHGGILNADQAMQNFCGVPYRHDKETYLDLRILFTSSVTQKSRSYPLDSGTFLGTSHVNVGNCGIDERIEVVEGFVVVDTEDKACFEELIKSCQGCLCLASDGLDDVCFDDVLHFTNTQVEGPGSTPARKVSTLAPIFNKI